MKDYLYKRLGTELELAINRIEAIQEALTLIESQAYHFECSLRSHWYNEGEENVTATGATREEAERNADDLFKKANLRSDVQADRSVCIIFENRLRVSLPNVRAI